MRELTDIEIEAMGRFGPPCSLEQARQYFDQCSAQISALRERERRIVEALERLIAAAECIRHWHDALQDNSGMVVSAEHVRALWSETERAKGAILKELEGE